MSEPTQQRREWTPAQVAAIERPELDLETDYLDRLRFPASRHRLVLVLGGIPVEVQTDSDSIHRFLGEHYGVFADPHAKPLVRVALGQTALEQFPFQTLIGTMMTYAEGGRTAVKFRQMAGYVDSSSHDGRGLVAGENHRQNVGNYLRFLIDAMTPPLDAILFHTAAVAHRDRAWLFFGPSTAGKSTLSKLSAPRRQILSDDMLVLRLEGGQLRAATCGFWGGETTQYPTARVDLPVQGLFRLRKGSENRLRPLPPVETALEVLCGIPGLKRPSADERFLLEFATTAANAVPGYELTFSKQDDSFWSLLDELD